MKGNKLGHEEGNKKSTWLGCLTLDLANVSLWKFKEDIFAKVRGGRTRKGFRMGNTCIPVVDTC